MIYKHKTFLKWLLYFVTVLSVALAFLSTGILPQILILDKSYLSIPILLFWLGVEMYSGYLAYKTSKEIWSTKQYLDGASNDPPPFTAMLQTTEGRAKKSMLESITDLIYNRNSFPQFASNVLIFAGLVGTLVGIILTFMPFMDPAVALDMAKIQANLGSIFSGVGAAFYPSLLSAVACTFLMVCDKILTSASAELSLLLSQVHSKTSSSTVSKVVEDDHVQD